MKKPIHVSDKKALQAQAAIITPRAIRKAQQAPPGAWNFASVTKEPVDAFFAFLERPRSELIMRAHATTAVAYIIADLQNRYRRSNG